MPARLMHLMTCNVTGWADFPSLRRPFGSVLFRQEYASSLYHRTRALSLHSRGHVWIHLPSLDKFLTLYHTTDRSWTLYIRQQHGNGYMQIYAGGKKTPHRTTDNVPQSTLHITHTRPIRGYVTSNQAAAQYVVGRQGATRRAICV